MKNPHPPALRKAIKDYKKTVADAQKIALEWDKAHVKLIQKIQTMQEQLPKLAEQRTKELNRQKAVTSNATLAIMTEANAAGLNAAKIILSLHATNTTTGQPRA